MKVFIGLEIGVVFKGKQLFFYNLSSFSDNVVLILKREKRD